MHCTTYDTAWEFCYDIVWELIIKQRGNLLYSYVHVIIAKGMQWIGIPSYKVAVVTC